MMLLKVLLILLIIYLATRAVGNLVHAVVGDGGRARARMQPPHREASPPSRPERTARGPRAHEDVEDAKWEDL